LFLKFFERTGVCFQLPLDSLDILLVSAVLKAYLAEDLSNLAQTINFTDVFTFT